ncbi:MAG: hypothetical protein J6S40_06310 [Thermoguttaceae bacterium]|nr:hypothetical protein [Thermoguttaceae bacterium]
MSKTDTSHSGTVVFLSETAAHDPKTNKWAIPILVLTVLFVGLTHYGTSPLRNIAHHRPLLNCDNNSFGTDQAVFLYIGRLVLHGGIPYRDAFDHKGPLIYLLDAAGLAIHGVFGVWLLELLCLAVSTVFAHKTARCFAPPGVTLFTTVISAFWFTARCNGNLCETWSIPFLLVSLYYWIRYLREDFQISKRAAFTVGFCFAAVLLMKPNLTALWMLFCLTVAWVSIRRRAFGFLVSRISVFLLGAGVLAFPILGWLWKNGAWNDFIEQFWGFNRIYCHVEFTRKLAAFADLFNPLPRRAYFTFFAVIGYIILARRTKIKADRLIFVSMDIFLILSMALMSMSGRLYRWYLPPLIVPFLPFLAAAFAWSLKTERAGWDKFLRRALLILLLVPTLVCDIPVFRPVSRVVQKGIQHRTDPETGDSKLSSGQTSSFYAHEIADWLKENTEPETRIANFGIGGRIFYWYAGRDSVSKYFYIHDTHLKNGYLPDIVGELKRKAPEVFIFQTMRGYPENSGKKRSAAFDSESERVPVAIPEEIAKWIASEGYRKVFENDSYEIYRK